MLVCVSLSFCAKNNSLMLAFTPSREAGVREIESLDLCLFLNVPLPSTGSVVGGGDGADVGGVWWWWWYVPPSPTQTRRRLQ